MKPGRNGCVLDEEEDEDEEEEEEEDEDDPVAKLSSNYTLRQPVLKSGLKSGLDD